jgi:hypothetical protein
MVQCPWCGSIFATHAPNCANCGAALPAPAPGTAPGTTPSATTPSIIDPEPAPPPRRLPKAFVRKLEAGHRARSDPNLPTIFVATMMGFMIAFPVLISRGGRAGGYDEPWEMGVLGIAGAIVALGLLSPIWRSFARWARVARLIRIYEAGRPAVGRVFHVDRDEGVVTLEYAFEADGRTIHGETGVAGEPPATGDPIHVLYLERSPAKSVAYPPARYPVALPAAGPTRGAP